MTSRAEWIDEARAAMQRDGDPAARAVRIQEALSHLRPYARTDLEIDTLRELQLAALVMVDVEDIRHVPPARIHGLAVAWLAFERTWEGAPAQPDAARTRTG